MPEKFGWPSPTQKVSPPGNPDIDKKHNSDYSKEKDIDIYNEIVLPDAFLNSLSLSAGFFGWYFVWSFDMVITSKQVGYFSAASIGPGFGTIEFPDTIPQHVMDNTLMTPQIGATLVQGVLWGESLKQKGVTAYSGTSYVKGQSFLLFAHETIESVDQFTGKTNGDIKGQAFGSSLGVPSGGAYQIYMKGNYQPELSRVATTALHWLGILH